MRRVDRLILKANKKYKATASSLFMAFITPVNGEFVIEADIQTKNGVERIKEVRTTLNDAQSYLEELASLHPNEEQINIFIDYGEEPEETI